MAAREVQFGVLRESMTSCESGVDRTLMRWISPQKRFAATAPLPGQAHPSE